MLQQLAAAMTDRNYRIFSESGELHLMNADGHWRGSSAFDVFRAAIQDSTIGVDAGHSFYLGYELARAEIAAQLGKQYQQDGPLQWGLLGESLASSTIRRREMSEPSEKQSGDCADQTT